jgi:hypothetical protein
LFGCVDDSPKKVIKTSDVNANLDYYLKTSNYKLLLPSIDGNTNKYLQTDGTKLIWSFVSGGGGGSPSGSDMSIQYNMSGAFGGDGNLVWDYAKRQLRIDGNLLVQSRTLIVNKDNNFVGIGFAVDPNLQPLQELDVSGEINLTPVAEPQITQATFTVEYDPSYHMPAGTYAYSLGYMTVDGNTPAGYELSTNCKTVTLTSQGRVVITNIPVPTDRRVTKKIIYRGDPTYQTSCTKPRPLAFLNPDITSYTDDANNSALDMTTTAYRRDNTTIKGIFFNNNKLAQPTAWNTAYGYRALNTMTSNAYENTAVGRLALANLRDGTTNTAIGTASCQDINNGTSNTCLGAYISFKGTSGNNVAAGRIIGYGGADNWLYNVLIGDYILSGGGTSTNNTIVGAYAGQYRGRSIGNVAIGTDAMRTLTTTPSGQYNTLIGTSAGYLSGPDLNYSVCIGYNCFKNAKWGLYNIAIGTGVTIDDNQTGVLNIHNIIYGTGGYASTVASSNPTTNGRIGIGAKTPNATLDVNGTMIIRSDMNVYGTAYFNKTPLSIWADGNISATGYITRTNIYEEKAPAITKIKDAKDYLKPNGDINHQAFEYSYVKIKRQVVIGQKPIEKKKIECEKENIPIPPNLTIEEEQNFNNIKETCKEITYIEYEPIYREIEEEGVDLTKEIALIKQAVYDIKKCIANADTLSDAKKCLG